MREPPLAPAAVLLSACRHVRGGHLSREFHVSLTVRTYRYVRSDRYLGRLQSHGARPDTRRDEARRARRHRRGSDARTPEGSRHDPRRRLGLARRPASRARDHAVVDGDRRSRVPPARGVRHPRDARAPTGRHVHLHGGRNPWVDQQWGAQVGMAFAHAHGGFASLLLLRAILVSADRHGSSSAHAARGEHSRRRRALLTLAGVAAMFQTNAMRPQLFALPLFAATLLILTERRRHPAWLWAIPAITVAVGQPARQLRAGTSPDRPRLDRRPDAARSPRGAGTGRW